MFSRLFPARLTAYLQGRVKSLPLEMGSMIKQSIIFSIPLCLSLGRSLEIMEPASARVSLIECKKKCSREWSWEFWSVASSWEFHLHTRPLQAGPGRLLTWDSEHCSGRYTQI